MIRIHILALSMAFGLVLAAASPSHAVQLPAFNVGNVQTLPAANGRGLTLQSGPSQSSNLGAFNIVIVPTPGLAGNLPALAAFQRAANLWAAKITDPITVTINADLAALGPGIIGSTNSVSLVAPYDSIRDQMVIDANTQPPAANNAIVGFLPTFAQLNTTLPPGVSLDTRLVASKANLKAMGATGLDGAFGVSDATITFSNAFNFDYNNADGVTPGQTDFETVAAHEIGHVLGFFSSVDDIVAGETTVLPSTLDLFRFARAAAGNPTNTAQFTSFPRNLFPGTDDITDDLTNEWRMSTGLTGAGTDGRQASHWKSDELTGTFIGIMDPTLSSGVIEPVTAADFRALDLIGWDIAVPEPSSFVLLGLAAAAVIPWQLRRRRSA